MSPWWLQSLLYLHVCWLVLNLPLHQCDNINDYLEVTQPIFQPWISIVSTLWINVQMTLIPCWKWNKIRGRIFNVAQRRNKAKQSTTFIQCFLIASQRCFSRRCNSDIKLSQRCLHIASTLVKAISKPIWLLISIDLQIIFIDKFYSAKWENILYKILTIKALSQPCKNDMYCST